MNEDLNLVKILKDVPKGTKFYCTLYGDVKFNGVAENEDIDYPISFLCTTKNGNRYDCEMNVTSRGKIYEYFNGECVFFPSRNNRDWSTYKYTPLQPKLELKPFDRVLVRDIDDEEWKPALFWRDDSQSEKDCPFLTVSNGHWKQCIPYEGFEHLLGTTDNPNLGTTNKKGGEDE